MTETTCRVLWHLTKRERGEAVSILEAIEATSRLRFPIYLLGKTPENSEYNTPRFRVQPVHRIAYTLKLSALLTWLCAFTETFLTDDKMPNKIHYTIVSRCTT
jgi:hypothetical protein